MVRCGGHETRRHTLVVSLNAVSVTAMIIHYVHKGMVNSGGGISH
jgi:hypothetical protein